MRVPTLPKAFQDQFIEAYIHPLMKAGSHRYIYLLDLNPTRAKNVTTQPVSKKGYVFASIDNITIATMLSNKGTVSMV